MNFYQAFGNFIISIFSGCTEFYKKIHYQRFPLDELVKTKSSKFRTKVYYRCCFSELGLNLDFVLTIFIHWLDVPDRVEYTNSC